MQFFEPSFEWLTHLSSKLFWAPPSFDWLTLLSTILRNQLFRGLFLVIYSYGQFYEPSSEQGKKIEHFFEHLKECTYSQGPSFEWVYSHECSFGHFLKGSRSTRTLMGAGEGFSFKFATSKLPKFGKMHIHNCFSCTSIFLGFSQLKLLSKLLSVWQGNGLDPATPCWQSSIHQDVGVCPEEWHCRHHW